MPHALEAKLGNVRRSARRLVAMHGLATLVICVLAAAVLVSAADYVVNLQDRGLRLMGSLAVSGIAIWAAYRFLYRPLVRRWSLLDVARRVEQRFPILADQLSSALEFVGQPENDGLAGSPVLRRAVVLSTTSSVESLDFGDALERRPAYRALVGAAAIASAVLIVAVLQPAVATVALARLLRPFGSDAWPKLNDLAFIDLPERLALGQDFVVELVDRHGPLPERVQMYYRYADGEETPPEPMRRVGDHMLARREAVSRSFDYRAEGGDDATMPWRHLEVVEPPRVESLAIRLHPPAYTHWPAEPSEREIRALVGTTVELRGEATKRLARAAVRTEHGANIPLQLAADGYGFSLPHPSPGSAFIVERSGSYWIELVDEGELVGGGNERSEMRAIADAPPSVQWQQPLSDLSVTPGAVVPLAALAKDDLALAGIDLVYQRDDRTDEPNSFVVWWRASPAGAGPPGTDAANDPAVQPVPSQAVQMQWELGPLQLSPGSHVLLRAAASDFLPQTGTSPVRKLSIITPEELAERLTQRQTAIVAELARALKLQQEARQQVSAQEIQQRTVGKLTQSDVDQTQAAALNQRQVRRLLANPTEGLPAQVAALAADLQNNRVDHPDLARSMAEIADELARMDAEHLAAIERDLTAAVKDSQSTLAQGESPEAAQRLGQALVSAGKEQERAIESLEALLAELQQRDSYHRFGRDVQQMRRDLESLARSTGQLGSDTLGKDVADLAAQLRANLEKIAGGQADLARRMEKLEQQIDATQSRLAADEPLAAATLADALHFAREQGVAGQLRAAGAAVRQNQIGQAAASQNAALESLKEMADILANRREQELARLVKKLKEAETQLAELAQAQAGLRSKLMAAENEQESALAERQLQRLAKTQSDLADATARLARQLERLQATKGGRAAGQAADHMEQSAASGGQGDAQRAGQEADEAQQRLEEAAREVAQQRRRAEADLASEQLVRLEDTLRGLIDRQNQSAQETARLDELRTQQGNWSRSQTISVRQAAREQKALGDQTGLLGQSLAGAPVFRMAIETAAAHMQSAAQLLDRLDAGPSTVRAQQIARARLEFLLAALKPAAANPGQGGGEPKGGSGGAGANAKEARDAVKMLAELKLLRLLQQDLQERFAQLQQAPPDDRTIPLQELAAEQGRLADLLGELGEPDAPPDADPLQDLEPKEPKLPADADPQALPDNPKPVES